MDNTLKMFTVCYYNKDHEEDILEIPAYSFEQALLIGNIQDNQVIDSECSVRRYARH